MPFQSRTKQDLLSLCHSNLIPEQYHYFYEKLVSTNKKTTKPISNKKSELPSKKKTKASAKPSTKKCIKKKLF